MRVLYKPMRLAVLLAFTAACGDVTAPSEVPFVNSTQEATAELPSMPETPEMQRFAELLMTAGWAPPGDQTAPDRVIIFQHGDADGSKPPTVTPQSKLTTAKPAPAVTTPMKSLTTTSQKVEVSGYELEALVRLEGYFGCVFELDYDGRRFYMEAVRLLDRTERDWQLTFGNPSPAYVRSELGKKPELAELCRS